MKIRVVRCFEPTRWYSNLIGQVFEVERCNETEFFTYAYKAPYGCYNFFDYRDVEELFINESVDVVYFKDVCNGCTRIETLGLLKDSKLYSTSNAKERLLNKMKESTMKAEEEKAEFNYPCLKESYDSDGLIVLFNSCKEGMVVKNNIFYNIGFYSKSWSEEDFKFYRGALKLSNGE